MITSEDVGINHRRHLFYLHQRPRGHHLPQRHPHALYRHYLNPYSAFLSSSAPAVDSSLPAVTMAWQYIGQLIFNMLILTGLVRGASRIVKEMFGL